MSTPFMLSKSDANRLLDIIHRSLSCTNEEEFRALVDELKCLIPYSYATCLMADTDKQGRVNSFEVINVSYPLDRLL